MSSQTILIVDDEANQRLMLEQALRALGDTWVIKTAATGQEALAYIGTRPPDLIITDYHMPTMNGLDLISHIRDSGIPSHIILITAYSSPEVYDAAQRLQVDHYLTKPVPLALLRRLIKSVLEEPESRARDAS